MKNTISLKLRLMIIILTPLMLVSIGVAYWAYENTRMRVAERFDSSLLATATAISQDIAQSNGDALSLRTRDLINDTSGGQVYYHAYAPDGAFVTGYATPPVSPRSQNSEPMIFFRSHYLGKSVRVVRIRSHMQIDGLSGTFNFTVWQNTATRDSLISDESNQTFLIITVLGLSVALIVWIGVSLGLSPLIDLQNAISIRSTSDLTPIRRAVPKEVKGIVSTLNSLLKQVNDSISNKNAFISNAAHQLQNPLAGVMAMAEAVKSAPNAALAVKRTDDLYEAAQQASELANKLLSFERANQAIPYQGFENIDINDTIKVAVSKARKSTEVAVEYQVNNDVVVINADHFMIGEAIYNLIDNALKHGGEKLTRVSVNAKLSKLGVTIVVKDNGKGIAVKDQGTALERFGQLDSETGSGLGLSIVQSVIDKHNGSFVIDSDEDTGLTAKILLPITTTENTF